MIWVLILCDLIFISEQFEVPEAIVEAYHPKGFSVSIPDQKGITLFAFHGNINEQIKGREPGTFSIDVVKPKFGKWTFSDRSTRLRVGDKIYFWTYVYYTEGNQNRGYAKDNQEFTITRLIKKPPGANKDKDSDFIIQPIVQPSEVVVEPVTENFAPNKPTTDIISDGVCNPSITVVNGKPQICKDKLIFNEPFNAVIRTKYWKIENIFAGKPDYEFVLYMDKPDILYIADKALEIKPALTENVFGPNSVEKPLDLASQCTGIIGTADCYLKPDAGFIIPPVISAKITTQGKFSFKYGKIEIKAKLPKGDWLYPILTLNPVREVYGSGYDSGQIRIAFSPGNTILGTNLYGGAILGDTPVAKTYAMRRATKNIQWSSHYHRFGLVWTESRIELLVNDKAYGTIETPDKGYSSLASLLHIKNAEKLALGSKWAPYDQEMYISVGVGAGGFNFEDRADGTKPWRNGERLSTKKFYLAQQNWSSTWDEESKLSVTYIRVWTV